MVFKVTQGEKKLSNITVTVLMADKSLFLGGTTNNDGIALFNVEEKDARWVLGA